MIAIPAIDISNGKVTRLKKGEFGQAVYYETTPDEMVQKFLESGFKRVHIVDLDGSRDGGSNTSELLKRISKYQNLDVEFGGGIRTFNDIEEIIKLGVSRLIIGSMAFLNRTEFERSINQFGSEKFILAADVYEKQVKIKGWTKNTNVDIFDHIKYGIDLGIREYLITDISKDGMLGGPAFELYSEIAHKFPEIDIIVSGGIASMKDVELLAAEKYFAVIVGKALYENKISLEELSQYAG